MIKSLKSLFKAPSASKLAKETLEEYQRRQIQQQEAAAYHAKMAEYYGEGIKRLAKASNSASI